MRRAAEGLAIPVAVLAVWEALSAAGVLPRYVSRPSAVGAELSQLVGSGDVVQHAAVSLYRSMAGLAIGALSGVVLGLLSGSIRAFAVFFDPLVSFTNPVPKIAILPVLIVWFGITDTSKIVLIAITTFYPCFIAAYAGVRQVQPAWIWAARNMGARADQVFRKVIVPAASPHILGGLRIALALAFILMFASEAIGTAHRAGLGYLVIFAESGGRHDLMLAAITAIGLLGFAADRLLLLVARRVLRWQPEVFRA